ncbi:Isotrichodermin C-15 hydroxylase [Elsinoe australis]|uniref:Isotrichodermin C-15 hydroxylase n=1 Tax=Elsinoe australis TaxID=40998 RepID=A0A2P7YDF8_9PEZI|nr:Isotrichodermin C-15 hydroxylase [Elsinoe australis]
MSGRLHRSIEYQHQLYGPVVRVSPNELSFASVGSWKAIYGPPSIGKQHCIKSEFYDVFAADYDSKCIGSERNPVRHAQMKKNLSAAFSTKALLDQEHIIRKCVDSMVAKVRLRGSAPNGINMTHWAEMVSFDILGEMAFGESFHCVQNEAPHFWFEMLTKYLFFITLVDNLRRLPFVPTLGKLIAPLTAGIQEKNHKYSRELVKRRLANDLHQKDFMTNIVEKVRFGEVSEEELTAHAATLVVAGGETISTFLAATTFYLCKTPKALEKLQTELRTRYTSADEINATSAGQLPYLQAVIQEGLRIFPPGSQGFPRISSGVQVDGCWIPQGTEIYTSAWTVTHDERYFKDPEAFVPERWLASDNGDLKEASQPFSLGPRACLGRNFAMVEACLILGILLFEFDIQLVDSNQEWEPKCHMHVNWLKPDLPVRFVQRTSGRLV